MMSAQPEAQQNGSNGVINGKSATGATTPDAWDQDDNDVDENDDDEDDSVDTNSEEEEEEEEENDQSGSDSDVAANTSDSPPTPAETLATYSKLLSRRVDLVGDYAGDELFLIEGDSMLRRCFDDDRLDFSIGLQLLHAVYNVEHFLHQLVKRKCNFNIVFFDSNRELCVPPSADEKNTSRYHFARAAIIRHLRVNIAKKHPGIRTDDFKSWDSTEFAEYLQHVSPYFLMAHDGARTTVRKKGNVGDIGEENKSTSIEAHPVALRQMILSFIRRGFNVALVNGLEWRDTKVMTMVLEPKHRASAAVAHFQTEQQQSTVAPSLDVTADIRKLQDMYADFTERQLLAILVVKKLAERKEMAQLCGPFLLHLALLSELSLTGRRINVSEANEQGFLNEFSSIAESIIQSPSWKEIASVTECDIMDATDGRLFCEVVRATPTIPQSAKESFDRLLGAVDTISSRSSISLVPSTAKATANTNPTIDSKSRVAVLPFYNKVFDKHLESVHLKIDSLPEGPKSIGARKVFQEVSHWHNYKRPIIKRAAAAPQTFAEARRKVKEDKRNQWFMAEMRTYAASLTNAVGKALEPETIIVGVPRQSTLKSTIESPADSEVSDSGGSTQSKGKPAPKKGGGKTAAKNAGKQAMLNQIAAAKAKKDESAGDKILTAWKDTCKAFEADNDPRSRYRRAKEYSTNIRASWRETLGAEVELYMLNCLLLFWIEACRRGEERSRYQVAALIWSHARSIAQQSPLPTSIARCLELVQKTLRLPSLPLVSEAQADRKLAFTFALPTNAENIAVQLQSKEFQLLECGPYLERSFDSRPDPRVEFQPDGWQRKVLDTIDEDKSAFVVAPTSAGKTFISFYAMRKVLEADDDGVLVYVAPTKALVNQIAAEVQARYSKRFKFGGKSVWGIHTRDYRINNATGCQVLVTVPHVLQIMLLAPSHANSWSARVKRIIFDEIHSIGQAEDGVVWEQLLLMAPCPIIALSATVGNPEEFSGWLATTQQAIGKELVTVKHPHRYSDLRKYFYVPPKKFSFHALPKQTAFGSLGLEGLTGFSFIHPVAGLVDKTRGIPADLSLEARDCFTLWQAMRKVQTNQHLVPVNLDPSKALPDVSGKVNILSWEQDLKDLLQTWLEDPESPYDALVRELEQSFRDESREEVYSTDGSSIAKQQAIDDPDDLIKTTLPLLCRLHAQAALPAILFNYDRFGCEEVCRAVVEQLQESEEQQVKSGAKWQRTLEKYEEWKKLKEKAASKKVSAKKGKLNEGDDKASKLDQERDAGNDEASKWESFDPEGPAEGYHFADYSKVLGSELAIYTRQLRRREIPEWLISSLWRGVGVHHAGMNRKYRQVVEILFRAGFLRVIVATGTLALGINMPCKTVVFSGDSVFLTALNYRQCAGRAGRRGFDLLGNVVFQGISRQKVCRLISSRLPDLNGHFPITTTLVLRLFTLLHESKGAKYSVSAINSLLSQPRLYMGGPSFKNQTMHHLRFSIEYLRRQQLLGSDGAPLNFAGLVSHLYFTENSAFAFHALLKEGYFHELCSDIKNNEKMTLETLMLVLAHLFNRVQCRQADKEYHNKVKKSSSIVFLPKLPKKASEVLMEHNQQTLQVYRGYVQTFVEQHITYPDRTLPLSGMSAGAANGTGTSTVNSLPPATIRSSFVALSGAGDDFENIHDLCQTTRDGVFLEEAVIPHMELYPEESDVPINAYLLDFYKHGDVFTIERANRIRRSDIWFLLNDFSLVLATITTSLMNFMKMTDASDVDMMDVMGGMDAHEEEEDDKVAAAEDTASEISGPSVADSAVVLPSRTAAAPSTAKAAPTKKQAKNADSWEDLAGDDDAEEEEAEAKRKVGAEAEALAEVLGNAAWEGEGGEGLKSVLKTFQKLQAEFNVKFRAMWA